MLIRKLTARGKLEGGTRPLILVLGQLCMIAAIVLGRLAGENGEVGMPTTVSLGDFWSGFLTGLVLTCAVITLPLCLTDRRHRRSRGQP